MPRTKDRQIENSATIPRNSSKVTTTANPSTTQGEETKKLEHEPIRGQLPAAMI